MTNLGEYRNLNKYNQEYNKQNQQKQSNMMPASYRTQYDNPDNKVEASAIINLNLIMLQKLLTLVTNQSHKVRQMIYKFIEICVYIKEIKPLILKDQTQTITIKNQIQISDNLKGEYAIIYLQKVKDGVLKVRSVRKALPKQVELHNILVQGFKKKYPFMLDQSQSNLNQPQLEQKMKADIPSYASVTLAQRNELNSWFANKVQFSVQQICSQFKQISLASIEEYLQLCQMEGNLANLQNKYIWMG